MQKTNFDWVLLIADDCSTDGTTDILLKYKKRYPSKIELILQSENVGAAKNWEQLITTPRSRYIAYFEGDDYWINENKLQQQVDFLEGNPDFSICCSNYYILDDSSKKLFIPAINRKLRGDRYYVLRDIVKRNFIGTLTVVFRRYFDSLPQGFDLLYPGDWPLHIFNASHGKIKYFPYPTAVYRIHNSGVCSSANPVSNYKRYLKTLSLVKGWFNKPSLQLEFAFLIARLNVYKDIYWYLIRTYLFKWVK